MSLEEIINVVKEKYKKEIEFVKIPEAQEFRETQELIKRLSEENIEIEAEKYPDSIF